jgi:hypothetical protein
MYAAPNADTPTTSPQMTLASDLDDAVTLRTTGGKPLRIRAELLAEARTWRAGAHSWHELLLYRRESGDYAVGLKSCSDEPGAGDVFHAQLLPDLESALSWIQAFDPTADLTADIDASDRKISATDIALRAAALRQRADQVATRYRTMVGELLYRIDLGE